MTDDAVWRVDHPESLFAPDARPVDVAILYALGMKGRAQYVARELRPVELGFDASVDADELADELDSMGCGGDDA